MLKKNLFKIILITLFMQGCSILTITDPVPPIPNDKPVVMFILDTSDSMNEQDLGQRKIDIAKESLINTVTQLDRTRYNAGLITFDGCGGTKLAVTPGDNLDNIVNITRSIEARELTPLAEAIRFSGEVLKNIENKMVILLSDGNETCFGDPVAEARKLHDRYGININFQVIGYAVDDSTRRQLKEISNISEKWSYYDAKDSYNLNKVIDEIMIKTGIRYRGWENSKKFVFEFDTDSAQLKEKYFSKIDIIYNHLKHNDEHIEIIGHTDSKGDEDYNLELSKKRAKAVKKELEKLGIDPNRIKTDGKGESEPKAKNDTEEGRRINRRVEILIQNP